ncbi:MAG TPA: UvrD-helicase domain-containing protein [Thermoanaerobaculia bacterium]|nr:UvrD-helicase domain-containing protein [Thermoanaerobaculia bacterium]
MNPQQQSFLFPKPGVTPPRRRNTVIEAGAGTGKTTAIVAEVLKILLSDESVAPERIVLMTFTEKAAGEIADRIHDALESVAQTLMSAPDGQERPSHICWPAESPQPPFAVPRDRMDSYRETCRKQLERIDGLRSQTIHSFCQSLLRMFPIEAGLDPQFRIIEGFERSLLYSQLYDKWADQETRIANDPGILSQWEALLAHTGYLFRIREMVYSLAGRRDLLDDDTYTLGELDEIAGDIEHAVAALRAAPPASADDDPISRLIAYVQRSPLPPASVDAWIEYFAPVASDIRSADLPMSRAMASIKNALKVLRADGRKGNSIFDALVSHRAAVALIALTRRFVSFLDDEKRLLGVADFDDLLIRTAALLEDPQIAERVRQQFDFIFVDEFQDTDRTQARIIERLASDRLGAWVEGKTLIVGDPKQSIYGFRRADPETYRRFSDQLTSAGGEHRLLRDQYRTHPHLLGAFNSMFQRVFANSGWDANVFRPAYHDLRPALASHGQEKERITFLHAPTTEGRERQLGEAEVIAEWIRSRGGELRDYAILLRRLSKLDLYLDTFDRYGIDYVLPPTRAFLDRRAAVDIVAVLRAIAYPFDLGSQVSAARTPYIALTDEEIAEGVLGESATWSTFNTRIAEYRAAAKHLDVSGTIDLIVESSNIETIYEASTEGRRALRHLEHLRAMAFVYDQKSGGSIRQFVGEIDRRRSEPDEMEPSLADDDSNAVRILSVHAAKGLEFDTVILPDLTFPLRGSDTMQVFAVEEPRSLVLTGSAQTFSAQFRSTDAGTELKKVGSEREEAENRRLFYVAVTRAKNEIVFVCNPSQHRIGFFATLCGTFDFDKSALESMWPAGDGRMGVALHAGENIVNATFEKITPGDASGRRKRLVDEALEQQLAAGQIVPIEIAPLSRSIDTLPPGEAAIGKASGANRAAGILLHRVLELWDGDADLEKILRDAAAECAAGDRELSAVRQRLATVRDSASFSRIIRGETVARELSIRFVDETGTLVEKRIDRLIRENGGEIVVDYKSGAPDPERLARDRDQVTGYCRAVEKMTGRPCAGLLWYIDAGNDRIVEALESPRNAAV